MTTIIDTITTTIIVIIVSLAIRVFIRVLLHGRQGDAAGGERVGQRLQGKTHLIMKLQRWIYLVPGEIYSVYYTI